MVVALAVVVALVVAVAMLGATLATGAVTCGRENSRGSAGRLARRRARFLLGGDVTTTLTRRPILVRAAAVLACQRRAAARTNRSVFGDGALFNGCKSSAAAVSGPVSMKSTVVPATVVGGCCCVPLVAMLARRAMSFLVSGTKRPFFLARP